MVIYLLFIVCAVLSENKRSILFRSLMKSLNAVIKDNIGDDLDLSTFEGTIKSFIVCISKILHNGRSRLQRFLAICGI